MTHLLIRIAAATKPALGLSVESKHFAGFVHALEVHFEKPTFILTLETVTRPLPSVGLPSEIEAVIPCQSLPTEPDGRIVSQIVPYVN